jgi:hypothetical protein
VEITFCVSPFHSGIRKTGVEKWGLRENIFFRLDLGRLLIISVTDLQKRRSGIYIIKINYILPGDPTFIAVIIVLLYEVRRGCQLGNKSL